ncbi:MAG: hypothetical protein L0191_20200, partial [Acidobacteria bacterium]|nr:hypothetical protein [Acidobacteriota bacterium]
MREFELYVPLNYNDGSPIEPGKFRDIQRRLLNEFGGCTFFPQPNRGFWQLDDVMYFDEIVIYRVLTRNTRSARQFFDRLKKELKRTLKQEEILII